MTLNFFLCYIQADILKLNTSPRHTFNLDKDFSYSFISKKYVRKKVIFCLKNNLIKRESVIYFNFSRHNLQLI